MVCSLTDIAKLTTHSSGEKREFGDDTQCIRNKHHATWRMFLNEAAKVTIRAD